MCHSIGVHTTFLCVIMLAHYPARKTKQVCHIVGTSVCMLRAFFFLIFFTSKYGTGTECNCEFLYPSIFRSCAWLISVHFRTWSFFRTVAAVFRPSVLWQVSQYGLPRNSHGTRPHHICIMSGTELHGAAKHGFAASTERPLVGSRRRIFLRPQILQSVYTLHFAKVHSVYTLRNGVTRL